MKTHLKTLIGALCAGAFLASPGHAQTAKISDGVVKIGVMTDLSGAGIASLCYCAHDTY